MDCYFSEEENIQELDENNTETKKEIAETKDDGFEVEDERRVHKEEGFQNSALKCIDPIIFAPTGDIYSYFQVKLWGICFINEDHARHKVIK